MGVAVKFRTAGLRQAIRRVTQSSRRYTEGAEKGGILDRINMIYRIGDETRICKSSPLYRDFMNFDPSEKLHQAAPAAVRHRKFGKPLERIGPDGKADV